MSERPSSSTQPRKQRLRLYQAAIHQRRHVLSAHLAEDLIVQFKRRAMPIRKGDSIKILRGDFKGKTTEVVRVDRKTYTIEAEGITVRRANGTEVARPIHPSNVVITKLNLSDPKRRAMLERKGVAVKAPPKEKPKAAAPKPPTKKGAEPAPPETPSPAEDQGEPPAETDPRAKEAVEAPTDAEKTTEKEGSA